MSFPGGNHMVSMCCLNCSLKLTWKLQISWFPCCLYVISMVFIWTPCDFKCRNPVVLNVDTIWFPHGHHVVSRKPHGNQHKKQLCMKPTSLLCLLRCLIHVLSAFYIVSISSCILVTFF